SESKSGMSVALGDAYNRGRLDVFVTNISERGYLFQNNNLRLNEMLEHARFSKIGDATVADAGWAWGAQFGDLNNVGFNDVIVANQNQPALLYRNTPDPKNHWIALKLVGTRSNRSAIGAEVLLESGDLKQKRVVDGGMGFASQNDRRVHFGLGHNEWVDRLV